MPAHPQTPLRAWSCFFATNLNLELKGSEQFCEKERDRIQPLPVITGKVSPTNSSDIDLGGVLMVSKRERILNAAEELFAEKGFSAATVEEVAKRAGIGKSTVYEYFSSKDEIFRQTLKAGLESYLDAMKGRLKQPCSVRDVLTAIGTAHFNFVKEHTFTARLLADEYNDTPWARQWLLGLRERRIAMFSSLIRQGIAEGEFRLVDPRMAAEVLLGVLNALCAPLLNGKNKDAVSLERFHRGIAIFFEGMLAK